MSDIQIGDKVLTHSADGDLVFSPVIMFLDRDTNSSTSYHNIVTKSGSQLSLTPSHLIYRASGGSKTAVFASEIEVGHRVYVQRRGKLVPEIVTEVTVVRDAGMFAPLTSEDNSLKYALAK